MGGAAPARPACDNPRVSQTIRSAASVIAISDGPEEPCVLMVERSPQSRFLAGYLVFPGGAVDAGDADLASRWFGSGEEATRAAAVRELAEEAGLALTAEGLREIHGGEPLAASIASPPTAAQLPEMTHWVAPDDVPVRFDARYYAVAASPGLRPTADGAEASRAWWVAPRELLAAWEDGGVKLYWPTYYTVTQLARCDGADELFGLRFSARDADDDEMDRLPRSVFWEG
jgi:8-oxo-dGTP pyrophosphatase MutT (NUDIX family)